MELRFAGSESIGSGEDMDARNNSRVCTATMEGNGMSDNNAATEKAGTVVFKSAFHRARRGYRHEFTDVAPKAPVPRVPVRKLPGWL
jgi:hypothetical protein